MRSRSSVSHITFLLVLGVFFLMSMTITFAPDNFPLEQSQGTAFFRQLVSPKGPQHQTKDDQQEQMEEEQETHPQKEEAVEKETHHQKENEEKEKETRHQKEEQKEKEMHHQKEEQKEMHHQKEETAEKETHHQKENEKEKETRHQKEEAAEKEMPHQEENEKEEKETEKEKKKQEMFTGKEEKNEENQETNPQKEKKQETHTGKEEKKEEKNKPQPNKRVLRSTDWESEEEAKCSEKDCQWKGPYLAGDQFLQEKVGCDPRSRHCQCLEDWNAPRRCPASFPEEKRLAIAMRGWFGEFMGRYVEGDYDCPHSAPHVVNFHNMDKQYDPDIYLSSDVYKLPEKWEEMRKVKQEKAKANTKMALLYIEAEPHVSNWFRTLPDIDISITFYNWADLHITHIQDHPSWFRNSPYPFHLKRNITFINTGCYGHRTELVKSFMEYIPVDALGQCLNNVDYCEVFPQCCKPSTPFHVSYTSRYVEKECLIYHYKFVLALENTITYNYTTEKFWQPLKMGMSLIVGGWLGSVSNMACRCDSYLLGQ